MNAGFVGAIAAAIGGGHLAWWLTEMCRARFHRLAVPPVEEKPAVALWQVELQPVAHLAPPSTARDVFRRRFWPIIAALAVTGLGVATLLIPSAYATVGAAGFFAAGALASATAVANGMDDMLPRFSDRNQVPVDAPWAGRRSRAVADSVRRDVMAAYMSAELDPRLDMDGMFDDAAGKGSPLGQFLETMRTVNKLSAAGDVASRAQLRNLWEHTTLLHRQWRDVQRHLASRVDTSRQSAAGCASGNIPGGVRVIGAGAAPGSRRFATSPRLAGAAV